EGNGPELTYTIRIIRDKTYLSIGNEEVIENRSKTLMKRTGVNYTFVTIDGRTSEKEDTVAPDEAAITHARFLKIPQLVRVQQALASIEIYTSLDLRHTWANLQASQTARSSNLV